MKKYIIATILAFLIALPVYGARTDGVWEKVSNYVKTICYGGCNVLIQGTNKYLNFGASSGTSGYGFRDSGGTIQYKNSGGSWAGVGSGGSGSTLHIDGGGFVYPQTGDYHSAPYYAATSTTATSTFPNIDITQILISGDYITDFVGSNLSVTNGVLNAADSDVFSWDTTPYGVSTSTTLGFLNGFLSTASSTISNLLTTYSTTTNATTTNLYVSSTLQVAGNAFFESDIGSSASRVPNIYATNINTNTITVNSFATGDLTVSGDLSVIGGDFNLGNGIATSTFIVNSSQILAITAATTTLSGGLNIESGGFVYDYSTNNIGIGTTSPAYLLDIDGDFRVGVQGTNDNILYVNTSDGRVSIATTTSTASLAIQSPGNDKNLFEIADSSGGNLFKIEENSSGNAVYSFSSTGISVQQSPIDSDREFLMRNINTDIPSYIMITPNGTPAGNKAGYGIYGVDILNNSTNYDYAHFIRKSDHYVLETKKAGSGTAYPLVLRSESGKVGINLPSGTLPARFLDIQDSGDNSSIMQIYNPGFTTDQRTMQIRFGKADATYESAILGYRYDTTAADSYTFMSMYGDAIGSGFVQKAGGNVGVGTTSPYAKLSVVGETVSSYFTATSTTATSTFSWGIEATNFNLTGATATSTASQGIDLSDGCFAVNGTCVDRELHMAKMVRSVAQSIPSGAWTKIAFDNEEFDVGGIADYTTNDRFDIGQSGKYLIKASVWLAGLDDAESLHVTIYKNGSSISRQRVYSPIANASVSIEVVEILELTAGDYLEMYVNQNEGASQDTFIGEETRPKMSVIQLSY